MSENAIVFAAFVPVLYRLPCYLDLVKKTFSDCDIYVGLNPSVSGTTEKFQKVGFNNISRPNPALVVNSDASAFQAALKTFKLTNKKYKNVYFMHTKGISYTSDAQWLRSYEDYFIGFCKRRNVVDDGLSTNGGVFYVGRKEPMNNSGYSTTVDSFYHGFPQKEVKDMMSLLTFYGIKGEIIHTFLNNCNDAFFATKLDRYFFEAYFPLIVDKFGYNREHIHIWN